MRYYIVQQTIKGDPRYWTFAGPILGKRMQNVLGNRFGILVLRHYAFARERNEIQSEDH